MKPARNPESAEDATPERAVARAGEPAEDGDGRHAHGAAAGAAAHVRHVLLKLDIPESDEGNRRVLAVLAHLREVHGWI